MLQCVRPGGGVGGTLPGRHLLPLKLLSVTGTPQTEHGMLRVAFGVEAKGQRDAGVRVEGGTGASQAAEEGGKAR